MQIVVFLIFLGLGGWLIYDRTEMSKDLEQRQAKIVELEKSLEETKKQAQLTLAELAKLDPNKAAVIARRMDSNAGILPGQAGSAQSNLPKKTDDWFQKKVNAGSSLNAPPASSRR